MKQSCYLPGQLDVAGWGVITMTLTHCLPLQRGSTSEAQAVGLFYEQRFKWVDLVWQLLQSALASPAVQAEEVTAVIASTVRRLLQQQQPGQPTVVARLLESIKVRMTALSCCEGQQDRDVDWGRALAGTQGAQHCAAVLVGLRVVTGLPGQHIPQGPSTCTGFTNHTGGW